MDFSSQVGHGKRHLQRGKTDFLTETPTEQEELNFTTTVAATI